MRAGDKRNMLLKEAKMSSGIDINRMSVMPILADNRLLPALMRALNANTVKYLTFRRKEYLLPCRPARWRSAAVKRCCSFAIAALLSYRGRETYEAAMRLIMMKIAVMGHLLDSSLIALTHSLSLF